MTQNKTLPKKVYALAAVFSILSVAIALSIFLVVLFKNFRNVI